MPHARYDLAGQKALVTGAASGIGLGTVTALARAGAVMPPKSTWFEPKLADGMVSHVLD